MGIGDWGLGIQRRACAARRVDRGVGYRDRDQVDQRQRQADGERRVPCRHPFVSDAHNDQDKHGAHGDFTDEP